MSKFTAGVMAGSILGAVGVGYMLRDKRTRKRLIRDSRRAMDRASDVIDNITKRF